MSLFLLLASALAHAQDIAATAPATVEPAARLVEALSAGTALGPDSAAPASTAVRLLLFLTGLSFLPAMVIVMTPFVRFVIVFSLLRQALGLQQSPPNQVIVGLSLFLTLLVMQPVFTTSWETGVSPLLDGDLPAEQALDAALDPFRTFMLGNTRRDDMAVILEVGGMARPETLDDIPTPAIASAFVLSELRSAFVICVYVFVPFLVIDLVVATILLGMGMMMLPPVLVSLPIKLLIFVLMDGWALLVHDLVAGVAR